MSEAGTVLESEKDHISIPKLSNWECYLWGSNPKNGGGFIYTPIEGDVPNFFIRYMMKVCFGCAWIRKR